MERPNFPRGRDAADNDAARLREADRQRDQRSDADPLKSPAEPVRAPANPTEPTVQTPAGSEPPTPPEAENRPAPLPESEGGPKGDPVNPLAPSAPRSGPQVFYGPKGQSRVINVEEGVPEGWYDHPRKVADYVDPDAEPKPLDL